MREVSVNRDAGSSNGNGTSAAIDNDDGRCAVDDGDWFSRVARALLRKKAGTALHYITGFDERLCQRYAAGHVRPPAYFFRCILRSNHGWEFLAGAMDGCEEKWWTDLQRLRDAGLRAEQFAGEILNEQERRTNLSHPR